MGGAQLPGRPDVRPSVPTRIVNRRDIGASRLGAETFRTIDAPPHRRADAWNEVYRDRFALVTFQPDDADHFSAELTVGSVGVVDFARVRSDKASVERTRAQANEAPERMLSFIFYVSGEGVFSQGDVEQPFRSGDIILCDNTVPHISRYSGESETIVVRAAQGALRPRIGCFDDLRGTCISGSDALSNTAFSMACNVSALIGKDLPAAAEMAISSNLLDVLATSVAFTSGARATAPCVATARGAQVRRYIEDNLSNSELSCDEIARALRISTRYMRAIMAESGESVMGYILRRRLEECAKELSAGGARHRNIIDIAYAWGFVSNAHFSRAFKARYGVPAREYRKSLRQD